MTAIGWRHEVNLQRPVRATTRFMPSSRVDLLHVSLSALKYSDIAGLERSIDDAYRVASQRLFDIFFDKFKLMNHLTALKSYLMLGHGDFADRLMDSLGYVG
jgi:Gamma tubulin complex component C-terminal